ncbi:MAG: GNAT family N-acetyltransferase [Clostridia bacterium]|nr:GNAT family N-acetyltransferase [Clostridia bacterium]
MLIELVPLKPGDPDLDELIRIHQEPSVSRFISISDNYFNYVTETEDVCYYKIITNERLAGGLHSEIHSETVYLSICVDEKYRRLGIAEKSLKKFFSIMPSYIKTIEASIEETNIPSVLLFQKLGFQVSEQDNELITYRKFVITNPGLSK